MTPASKSAICHELYRTITASDFGTRVYALAKEAAEAGDLEMYQMCARAMVGSRKAKYSVAQVLLAAEYAAH